MCYAKCSLKEDKAVEDWVIKTSIVPRKSVKKGFFGAHPGSPGILSKDFLVPDGEVSIAHVQLIYSIWEIGFLH